MSHGTSNLTAALGGTALLSFLAGRLSIGGRHEEQVTPQAGDVPAAHRGQVLTSIASRYPEVDPAAARRWFGSLSESDASIARPTFEGRKLPTIPLQR
jgi:hypothetical protein